MTAKAEHTIAKDSETYETARIQQAERAGAAKADKGATAAKEKRKSDAKVKSSPARHQKKHRRYEISSDAQEDDESEEELSPASAKRVRHAKAQRWAALHKGIHDGYRKYECNSDDSSTTMPYDEASDNSGTTMPYDEEEPDKDELQSTAMAHTSLVGGSRRMSKADTKAFLLRAKMAIKQAFDVDFCCELDTDEPQSKAMAQPVFHVDNYSENKKR